MSGALAHVKPQNILYVKKTQEFMWSDFDLAYVFNSATESKTYHPDFRPTRKYEAPEIQNPEGQPHGRNVDIFSLGYVFLNIVSVLVLHKEADVDDIPFHHLRDYKDNIAIIERWIKDRIHEPKKERGCDSHEDTGSQFACDSPRSSTALESRRFHKSTCFNQVSKRAKPAAILRDLRRKIQVGHISAS